MSSTKAPASGEGLSILRPCAHGVDDSPGLHDLVLAWLQIAKQVELLVPGDVVDPEAVIRGIGVQATDLKLVPELEPFGLLRIDEQVRECAPPEPPGTHLP